MEERKNVFGIVLLVIVLLSFVFGGYFLMNYIINLPLEEKSDIKKEVVADLRINKNKDYIYFDNTTEVIEEVYHEDVIINIEGYEEVNNTLHNELNALGDITKITTEEIPEDVTCEGDIYSFKYREYEVVEYNDYLSLVIIDKEYNCVVGTVPLNIKSIIIDKKSGVSFTQEEILNKYNITDEVIISKVTKRLEDTQIMVEDVEVIDLNATINELKESGYGVKKAISMNKYGKIMLNYIVKSNKINYNDSIELN